MIKLQGKLPRELYLACSGGSDSMAALDFLRRNHDVKVIFVHHVTEHSDRAYEFLRNHCHSLGIEFTWYQVSTAKPARKSQEQHWREERYDFFERHSDAPVITCHHLDDCVETWVWSSMHGTGKIIPYRNKNTIRPFRLTRKRDFAMWNAMHNVEWKEDDSNADICYTRNYIRHEMIPHVLNVNPGIHKVVARKVRNDFDS
jgi:tRNA(Ile)-lysidine synthase